MDNNAIDAVRAKVLRARWRVRAATVGSPEWDAALTGLEELEAELIRLTKRRRIAGTN